MPGGEDDEDHDDCEAPSVRCENQCIMGGKEQRSMLAPGPLLVQM
jgi:hypothetical protein